MRPRRLFTDYAASSRILWGICFVAGLLCLLSGVFLTVVALDHALLLPACLGAALLVGAVFLMETTKWLEEKNGGSDKQESAVDRDRGPKGIEIAIETAVLQALVLLLFGLLLDHGVRQLACLYSLLGYWAGAFLVFARRGKALTWGDRLYLRWGWLPTVVIGTVLFLRVWKDKGLI